MVSDRGKTMGKAEDLSGRQFGYWKVIERVDNYKDGSARWLCECECGNRKIHRTCTLKRGQTKSCGCHKNDYNKVHGGKGTRLYEIWRHMRYRCENQSNQAYPEYGARGISVC